MIKHIILWQLKESLSSAQKAQIMAAAKEHLEALNGRIAGLMDIHVITEKLASSNADMMLDSTFTTQEALQGYTKHPLHVAVAETYVRPFIQHRSCMDYEK